MVRNLQYNIRNVEESIKIVQDNCVLQADELIEENINNSFYTVVEYENKLEAKQ